MQLKILTLMGSLILSSIAYGTSPQQYNSSSLYGSGYGAPNVEVYYASWCELNRVVFNPQQNSAQPAMECSQSGTRCTQEEHYVNPQLLFISASCKP